MNRLLNCLPAWTGLLLLAACQPAGSADNANETFATRLAAMEAGIGGRIGVWVHDTDSGRTLGWRADERFAMASTFKPLLVAAVLAEVDAGRLSLSDRVALDGVTIQPYSPVVGDLPRGSALTLAELCEAAITLGDNTVTNVLLDRIGGPARLTAFLRTHGDDITRLDRYEVELNENAPGDDRDTTTPRAMANSLERFLFTDALGEESRAQLADWLVASRTGGARLRAGLPAGWRVGDKTGTGGNGAVNNVAVAWPGNGRGPLLFSVYLDGSEKDTATLNTIHPRIAALAVSLLGYDP